jgi:hypothetical protein
MRFGRLALVVVISAGLTTTAAQAADKGTREHEALKRMQQNTAKLQAEKQSLEREKQDFAAKADAATKTLDGLKVEATRAKRRVAVLDKEVDALRKDNAELNLRLEAGNKLAATTNARCEEAAGIALQNQKRAEVVNANLKGMAAKEAAGRLSCEGSNFKLRAMAHEILDRYQRKGVLESLQQAEPFTRLKSIEIENLAQDYQQKIDDLKVETRH